MFTDALRVDESSARALLERQFPALEGASVQHVTGAGTVNAIFRVGSDLAARFPFAITNAAELEREAAALTAFADVSGFVAPVPRGIGIGDASYPSAWSMQTWVPGHPADAQAHAASDSLADDLATLINALRGTGTHGGTFDGRGRGGALDDHDEWVATCFDRSTRLLDVDHGRRLWATLREAPYAGELAMCHRDLTPPNLLVSGSDGSARLVGVLDGGGFGPADPALDLVVLWHMFDRTRRERVRQLLGVQDQEWRRGAAWALQQSMGLGWYYARSNPTMSRLGLSTMSRLLSDPELQRIRA